MQSKFNFSCPNKNLDQVNVKQQACSCTFHAHWESAKLIPNHQLKVYEVPIDNNKILFLKHQGIRQNKILQTFYIG